VTDRSEEFDLDQELEEDRLADLFDYGARTFIHNYPTIASPASVEEKPKKDRALLGIFIGAIATVLIGGASAGVTLITQNPPDCAAIVQKYDGLMGNDPENAAILTMKGNDGKSILDSDQDALECGLDEDTLRRMGEPPKPP
jgi:hypothetical protein